MWNGEMTWNRREPGGLRHPRRCAAATCDGVAGWAQARALLKTAASGATGAPRPRRGLLLTAASYIAQPQPQRSLPKRPHCLRPLHAPSEGPLESDLAHSGLPTSRVHAAVVIRHSVT